MCIVWSGVLCDEKRRRRVEDREGRRGEMGQPSCFKAGEQGLRRRPAAKPPISLHHPLPPPPSRMHPHETKSSISPFILHPPNECQTEVISEEEDGVTAAITVEGGVVGPAGVVRRPVPRSLRRTTSST